MAKVKIDEAAADVRAILQSNGGEMTQPELVAALEAAGKATVAGMLSHLKQQGFLKFRVSADRDTAVSTLHVSLPN